MGKGLLKLRDKWSQQLPPPGEVNRESVFIVISMLTSQGTDVGCLFKGNQVRTLKEDSIGRGIILRLAKRGNHT